MDVLSMTMEKWGEQVELNYGIFCILPTLAILDIAVWKEVTFPAILAGVIAACFMVARGNPLMTIGLFLDQFYTTVYDSNTMWVLLLYILFRGLISLTTESGGVLGFTERAKKILNTRKKTPIRTRILGIIVFIDDSLSCLSVGAAIRPLSDEYKISREMVAYTINSTGVTVCVIIPISPRGAFMSGLTEKSGLTGGLFPFAAYCHSIPCMFYAIIAVICVPFMALGILPMSKNMREAEKGTLETGQVLPEESGKAILEGLEDEERPKDVPKRTLNLALSILVVIGMTIVTSDMITVLVAAIILCFVMYIGQGLMSVLDLVDAMMKGFQDIFGVVIMIITVYMLTGPNKMLGLDDFVMDICSAPVNPKLLLLIIFVGIGLLAFGSGSFWGLAAIVFPIVGSIVENLDLNPFLFSGAVISAVALGGHIYMHSDTVVLISASTQVINSDCFRTSFPITITYPFAIGAILLLIAGCIML